MLPKRWVTYLLGLSAWIIAALGLGAVFGQTTWWLIGGLTIWLAATLLYLYDLDRALDGRRSTSIVATTGLWAELLALVQRHKDKARSRKKKYHRLLREVRESTGALRDAGVILNAQNEIQWFNAAANRLLGLDASRDINLRIDTLVTHPDFLTYLQSTDDEEIDIPSPESPDGRLSVQIIPYSRNQRLAIFRDVTQAARLERMRRDFVANASHELRSPLTVFSGYLDALLEDDSIPSTWSAPVAEMQRQADRMTNIIRDLLELSRLESMDGVAGKEFVDIVAMLHAVYKECSETPAGPSLNLNLDETTALLGDETQLHSIVFNLINNARRFTPEHGKVHISWQRTPGGACFEVRDTGIGIPDELVTRVTERFFRVDLGRSRASGGTGLGLAIVKHALQNHGATLTIESQLGRGSVFSCHFGNERVVARSEMPLQSATT